VTKNILKWRFCAHFVKKSLAGSKKSCNFAEILCHFVHIYAKDAYLLCVLMVTWYCKKKRWKARIKN